MTQYVVSGLSSASFTLKAGPTFDTRIIRADFATPPTGGGAFSGADFYKYTGSPVVSSGSSITPNPMREGPAAPVAGATSRQGATVTGGTQIHLCSIYFADTSGGQGSYTPPTDLILRAGSSSVFAIGAGSGVIEIYFEELRLFWSL